MTGRTCLLPIYALIALALPSVAQAAQFDAEQSWRHGAWSTHLFRNLSDNRRFCAIEARANGTDFRINRYLDNGETFVEVFNSDWALMQGGARFTLDFTVDGENYQADLAGKSWGDSYTHDFTDVKTYQVVLGLIAGASSVRVKNSNGTILATFHGSGSRAALQSYNTCLKRS